MTIVRKQLNRIYKEKTNFKAEPRDAYVDIHLIPKSGPFRHEIPKYISSSSYVIADVTDARLGPTKTPGVFFEVGLALGMQKPIVLFVNERQPSTDFGADPFDVAAIPSLLRGEDVVRYTDSSRTFPSDFALLHEKLSGPLEGGTVDAQRGRTLKSGSQTHAFVSFQPRHRAAEEWCTDHLRQLFPELVIRNPSGGNQEWRDLFEVIKGASLSIVDCTEGINSSCLELGLAAASDPRKVLLVYDGNHSRSMSPVAMFPGMVMAWLDRGTRDAEMLRAHLTTIAQFTDLGTRR